MARSAKLSESPNEEWEEDLYDASPPPNGQGQARISTNTQASLSPSPATSISSDKENRNARTAEKGKGPAVMGPPSASASARSSLGPQKRKRAVTRDTTADRDVRRRTIEAGDDYDPDQPIEERREVRQGLRNLQKTLIDQRQELVQPDNDGLKNLLLQSDEFSARVKQTSDATIGSRFLVGASDTLVKKVNNARSGENLQGIDIGDLISRTLAYMRAGGPPEQRDDLLPPSGRRGRRSHISASGALNGDESDEPLNWEHLGRSAALPSIFRPSLPSFLLGPLSLQKRARKPIIRKAPLRHKDLQATRPEVLEKGDIERSENANLTTLCTQILARLRKVKQDTQDAAEKEYEAYEGDMTDEQQEELFERHGISGEGGISLFKFVVNPHSFGQTVENLFYASFLIRDGKVGINLDGGGMPFLGKACLLLDSSAPVLCWKRKYIDKNRYHRHLHPSTKPISSPWPNNSQTPSHHSTGLESMGRNDRALGHQAVDDPSS